MQYQPVTAEQITAIMQYVKDHAAQIKTEAAQQNELAVLLYGAYVGYKQQPTLGAARWLVVKYQRYIGGE